MPSNCTCVYRKEMAYGLHFIFVMLQCSLHVKVCMTSMISLKNGVTALHKATSNSFLEVVRLLLESGAKDIPDKVTILTQCKVVNLGNPGLS